MGTVGSLLGGAGDSADLANLLGGGSANGEEDTEELKIFTLLHADAANLSKVLDAIYGKQRELRIVPDDRTNSIIVKGKHEVIEEIEKLVLLLDKEVDSKVPQAVPCVRKGESSSLIAIAGHRCYPPLLRAFLLVAKSADR